MLLNTYKHHHIETIFTFKLLDLSSPRPYCTAADPQLIEQLERFFFQKHYIIIWIKVPSKHFLFSKTSWRRLEDVFRVTLFVFQDLFKTSSRRICNTSSRHFQDVFKTSSKTSSRRVCKTSCNYVFKTSSRRLGRQNECLLGLYCCVFSNSYLHNIYAIQ